MRARLHGASCTHIPDPGAHLVRYYGAYSNRARRASAKQVAPLLGIDATTTLPGADAGYPAADPDEPAGAKRSRMNWARLIKKIFEVDPLLCTACGQKMQVISFITQPDVIDRIRRHLRRKARRAAARDPPFQPDGDTDDGGERAAS